MAARSIDLDSPRRRRGSWVPRIAVCLLLIVIGILGLTYREQVAEAASRIFSPANEDPIPVVRMEKGPFLLKVPAFGEVTGLETTPVQTPSVRTGGLKIAWLIPEGSIVQENDVLMKFDATEARLNFERQQNSLDSTGKRIDLTRSQQTSNEMLLGIDSQDAQKEYDYAMNVMPEDDTIFSKWEIIEAQINAGLAKEKMSFIGEKLKVNRRSARADMQILNIEKGRASQEINIAQQTLDSLELRSPKEGLVLYRRDRMRDPQVGDELWTGQVVVELVNLSMLQAKVFILEMDAGQVAKGQEVAVRLDAIAEREFHGKIKSMAALAQPRERNSPLKYFECEVLIGDAGEEMRRIRPGMGLKADVILDSYDSVFVVPNSSVSVKDGKPQVFVREGKNFVARPVEIGSRNHGQTVVLAGLNGNEMVAMRDPFDLRKSYLPDFSKAGPQQEGGGAGREIRIMMGGGPGGGGGRGR